MAVPAEAAEPAFPDDAVEVARIADAWGLKGWFRVQAFAADPQAIFSSRRWFLRGPDAAPLARPSALPAVLRIAEVREHGDGVVARAHEIDDRVAAESLRGARVFVARSSFPTAGDDEYYWVDLIGLTVVNRDGAALGRVVGLLDTGPHSVLRIAPDGASDEASQTLIPFVAAYVDGVDLPGRRISVDWGPDY